MTRAIWIWRKWVSMLCGYATTPSLPLTSNHTWVLCFSIPNPLRRTYQTGSICVWGKSATTVLLCVCVCVYSRFVCIECLAASPEHTHTPKTGGKLEKWMPIVVWGLGTSWFQCLFWFCVVNMCCESARYVSQTLGGAAATFWDIECACESRPIVVYGLTGSSSCKYPYVKSSRQFECTYYSRSTNSRHSFRLFVCSIA